MKNYKKIFFFCIVLALIGVTSICFGDSNPGKNSKLTGSITILFPWTSPNDMIDSITGLKTKGAYAFQEALQKKFPNVKIVVNSIPTTNWIQKTETFVTSGEADIAFYTNQVQAAKWFTDLKPYMKNDKDVNTNNLDKIFIKQTISAITYHTFDYPADCGNIYGLPVSMSVYPIYYDKQIFDDWGVAYPKNGATYEQLLAMAKKMTGKDPKTGKQTYGLYLQPYWLEWHAIGFNAVHSIKVADMKLANINMTKDVDYIKNSPDVLRFFSFVSEAVKCAPPGAATATGNENWLTPNNNVAINLDINNSSYTGFLLAKRADITNRFIPLALPKSTSGMAGFPEIHSIAISDNCKNKNLAWEILKAIATDKSLIDLYIRNYSTGSVTALNDPSGLSVMNLSYNKWRYKFQKSAFFTTDDYWYWRTPIQGVIGKVLTNQLTPMQARIQFYNDTKTWLSNEEKQISK